ncbi:MAG: hypothetical protein AAF610_00370 [Pseudomonadota bacterium]
MKNVFAAVNKRHSRAMLIGLALLLAGCYPSEVNVRPTLTADTVVPAGAGVLVAKVINATSYPLPINQLTVTPEDINATEDTKPFRLLAIDRLDDQATIFSTTLPPGRYALRSVRAFHVFGEVAYSRFVGADVTFGTFDVERGKVTDLGSIVYYRQIEGEGYDDVLFRIDGSGNGDTMTTYFPFVSFAPENTLTWNDDGLEQERQDAYLSAVQNPNVFTEGHRFPDGGVLFTGPLGVTLERQNDGQFVLDAVDTNGHLFAAAQNAAGDRAVGGAEGALYTRAAGGQWEDRSLPAGQHVDQLKYDADGRLLALARRGAVLSLLRLEDDQSWNELNRFSPLTGWREETLVGESKNTGPAMPLIVASGLYDFAGEPYVRVAYRDVRYDTATPKWRAYAYDPATHRMTRYKNEKDRFSVFDGGSARLGIQRKSFLGLSSAPKWNRYDPDEGWQEIKFEVRVCNRAITEERYCGNARPARPSRNVAFTLLSVPWFDRDDVGYTFAAFPRSRGGLPEEYGEPRLYVTKNGGQFWTDTGFAPPKPYCTNLVGEFTEHLLISCNGTSGEFYESTDGGENWERVRELEAF